MGPISEYRKLRYAKAKWKALIELLEFFGGNCSLAARECCVSRQTIMVWKKQGYVGAVGAIRVHHNPNVPFNKQMLRPDLKPEEWRRIQGQYDPKWTRGLIKEQDRLLTNGHL